MGQGNIANVVGGGGRGGAGLAGSPPGSPRRQGVSEATEAMLPGQCVVAADVERRLLLEEEASLEALADSDNLDAEGAGVSGKKERKKA